MNQFAQDVHDGLSASRKQLSSKYFYDDQGSRIFKQIMEMPEYYLTNAEFEILSNQADQIYQALEIAGPFDIIEFGAGDGIKTKQLLEALVKMGIDFSYRPVDISAEANRMLTLNLQHAIPQLEVSPIEADYFGGLKEFNNSNRPALLLFLGSNIGNYFDREVRQLLRSFRRTMTPQDKLLIGFDLQKNPTIIRNAYDDPHGVTRAFNLNLLTRINRELDGNFDLDLFDFYCEYNPVDGEVRSYLVSKVKQLVLIGATETYYSFEQNELINTELSRKYTPSGIHALAAQYDMRCEQLFLDCRHYFANALWSV